MPRKTIPLEKRFWSKVRVPLDPEDCWEWQSAIRNGYGVIGLGRRSDGIEYAHRISFLTFNEFIPEGHEICHGCGNRRCVNPHHLYAGSRSDNMRHAWATGAAKVPNRHAPGFFHMTPNQRTK